MSTDTRLTRATIEERMLALRSLDEQLGLQKTNISQAKESILNAQEAIFHIVADRQKWEIELFRLRASTASIVCLPSYFLTYSLFV